MNEPQPSTLSPEHQAVRLGKVTASRLADVMARTKTGWGASRANYMAQLLCERLTGTQAESYTNAAMQWGIDTEEQARAAYELVSGSKVSKIGFVPHPTIAMSGASPDGLVDDAGLVEFKCPITATHIDTLLNESVDGKYLTQMQWQMACTGRKWCDFVSFDPRLPSNMQLFMVRIDRDNVAIRDMEAVVSSFLAELDAKHKALIARYGDAP